MFGIKVILSSIAVVLTFIGYFPYIRSVIKKQTKPHLFTWFIWLFDDCVIFALQVINGAGIGALFLLATVMLSIIVIFLTIRNKEKQDIMKLDLVFAILAISAFILWIFVKQPLISTLLIVTVDIFAILPTIRKSWNKPHTENVSFYAINMMRFGFALAALQKYSLITMFYLTVWFFGSGLFSLMLIIRRKVINLESKKF
jgi:hypothetical protein